MIDYNLHAKGNQSEIINERILTLITVLRRDTTAADSFVEEPRDLYTWLMLCIALQDASQYFNFFGVVFTICWSCKLSRCSSAFTVHPSYADLIPNCLYSEKSSVAIRPLLLDYHFVYLYLLLDTCNSIMSFV